MTPIRQNWAVILAAGNGARARAPMPKQFLDYRGAPLYWRSVLAFARSPIIDGIILVLPSEWMEREKERVALLRRRENVGVPVLLAGGGASRRDSAREGVAAIPSLSEKIFIHDAARPFVSGRLIWRASLALTPDVAGVVPVTPITDTVKLVKDGVCAATLDRSVLAAAQTPQVFWAEKLLAAQARAQGEATDDASELEALGEKVIVIDGDKANVKITSPEDLELLREATIPLVGHGYDVHAYGGDRPLKIGGVSLPGGFFVRAHSDGDVLLHALIDAILGCAGLGDIGRLFPDDDPRFENISSAILLDEALSRAREAGVSPTNVDLTLVAQNPKIAPFAEEIRKNVARLLSLPKNRVNFKATTEEGLGFTGGLAGIKAYAVVCARSQS